MFVLIIIACAPSLRPLFHSRDGASQTNPDMNLGVSLECILAQENGMSHPYKETRNEAPSSLRGNELREEA